MGVWVLLCRFVRVWGFLWGVDRDLGGVHEDLNGVDGGL